MLVSLEEAVEAEAGRCLRMERAGLTPLPLLEEEEERLPSSEALPGEELSVCVELEAEVEVELGSAAVAFAVPPPPTDDADWCEPMEAPRRGGLTAGAAAAFVSAAGGALS